MHMTYGISTMTDSKPPRGRPKGSGIDDRIWLREIERLMRIDPALRPTSAIKALGVTDPSAIRRLRDKYAARTACALPGTASKPSSRQRVAVQAARGDPVVRHEPAGPRLVTSATAATDTPQADTASRDASADCFTAFWGLVFQTTTLMTEMNVLTLLALARNPAASLALAQHLAIGDALASSLRLQAAMLAAAKR